MLWEYKETNWSGLTIIDNTDIINCLLAPSSRNSVSPLILTVTILA